MLLKCRLIFVSRAAIKQNMLCAPSERALGVKLKWKRFSENWWRFGIRKLNAGKWLNFEVPWHNTFRRTEQHSSHVTSERQSNVSAVLLRMKKKSCVTLIHENDGNLAALWLANLEEHNLLVHIAEINVECWISHNSRKGKVSYKTLLTGCSEWSEPSVFRCWDLKYSQLRLFEFTSVITSANKNNQKLKSVGF